MTKVHAEPIAAARAVAAPVAPARVGIASPMHRDDEAARGRIRGILRATTGKDEDAPRALDAPGEAAVPSVVREVIRSPGQPLDTETRAFMEARFGHALGGVRVHTGAQAAASAAAIGARAYTVGRDVVFGEGQLAPATASGRRLLAHELAHVVQQSGGGAGRAPSTSAERDAKDAARAVEEGGFAHVAVRTAVGVAREQVPLAIWWMGRLSNDQMLSASFEKLDDEIRITEDRARDNPHESGHEGYIAALRRARASNVGRTSYVQTFTPVPKRPPDPPRAAPAVAAAPPVSVAQEARDRGQSSKDVDRALEWAGQYNFLAKKAHEAKSAYDMYQRFTSGETTLAEKIEIGASALSSVSIPAQIVKRAVKVYQGVTGLLKKGDKLSMAKSVGKILQAVPGSEAVAPMAEHAEETAFNAAKTVDMASERDLGNAVRSGWDTYTSFEKTKNDAVGLFFMGRSHKGGGAKPGTPSTTSVASPGPAAQKAAGTKATPAPVEPRVVYEGWNPAPVSQAVTKAFRVVGQDVKAFVAQLRKPQMTYAGGDPGAVAGVESKPPRNAFYTTGNKPPPPSATGKAGSASRPSAPNPLRLPEPMPEPTSRSVGKDAEVHGIRRWGATSPPENFGAFDGVVGGRRTLRTQLVGAEIVRESPAGVRTRTPIWERHLEVRGGNWLTIKTVQVPTEANVTSNVKLALDNAWADSKVPERSLRSARPITTHDSQGRLTVVQSSGRNIHDRMTRKGYPDHVTVVIQLPMAAVRQAAGSLTPQQFAAQMRAAAEKARADWVNAERGSGPTPRQQQLLDNIQIDVDIIP